MSRQPARQFRRHLPEVHHLPRAGRAFHLEIVAEVVVELLQRFDQQVVDREPDRPAPVGVAAEQRRWSIRPARSRRRVRVRRSRSDVRMILVHSARGRGCRRARGTRVSSSIDLQNAGAAGRRRRSRAGAARRCRGRASRRRCWSGRAGSARNHSSRRAEAVEAGRSARWLERLHREQRNQPDHRAYPRPGRGRRRRCAGRRRRSRRLRPTGKATHRRRSFMACAM